MTDSTPRPESKRVLAGVLGIVFSPFSLHRFVLGDVTGGLLRLLLCFNLGGLLGLIEGIIYLTKTDQQFVDEYQIGKKAWF